MLRFINLFFLLVCITSPLQASFLIKGRIEVVSGRVYIYRGGRTLQAVDDMNIYTGDLLETARGSSIMFQLMDVGLVKLKPETQIQFPEGDNEQIQASRIELKFGEIWSKIRPMVSGEIFDIITPGTAVIMSDNIAVIGYDKRKRRSTVSCIEGRTEAHRDTRHHFLLSGERLVIDDRKGSRSRQSKFDMYALNQEWKDVITIRDKLDRKLRQTVRMPDEDGQIKDFEPPRVYIVSPLEGVPVRMNNIEVRATIFDENPDRVILTVNGEVMQDVQTKLENFVHPVLLTPGDNEIELKAIDRYGNVGVDVRRIRISELPPSITIFYPFDNQDLDSRFVDLQGVVDDPEIREVEIYLNHRLIAKERATPTFTVPVVLDIGRNILRVEAENAVGLRGVSEAVVHTDTKTTITIPFQQLFN
jgi:hypothetical protein